MKVTNVHHRTYSIPIEKITELFDTLSGKNDKVWPVEK